MSEITPDYLKQGEPARLFPVLSNTSKEGRTTSVVLACLAKIDEFGAAILKKFDQRVGSRAQISTFTEIVCKTPSEEINDRPDGLIVLKTGRNEWRALVETKVGNNTLNAQQVERYRGLAKANDFDCVITISNQFATAADTHPLAEVRKSRSRIPVYHLSWMSILTEAELLIQNEGVGDVDQYTLLNELRRFLSHESAGVQGFDRMPSEWGDLNKLISSGGVVALKSEIALTVVEAWHQETRDLALILSRMTEISVSERLTRKHRLDQNERTKAAIEALRDHKQLRASYDIPNAAATLEMVADLTRRTIEVGMTLRAPEDKVSTKARMNWLLRQLPAEIQEELFVKLNWPGKSDPTIFAISEIRENLEIVTQDREHLSPHSFHLFTSTRLGARFTQRVNFISDLERLVPEFYRDYGSRLSAWQKPAPKVKKEKASADDVTTDAIQEDATQLGKG